MKYPLLPSFLFSFFIENNHYFFKMLLIKIDFEGNLSLLNHNKLILHKQCTAQLSYLLLRDQYILIAHKFCSSWPLITL